MTSRHRTKHTVPLVSKPERFFGCHLATRGKFRMGFAVAFQQALGRRPSETLALLPESIMRPERDIGKFVIRLGADVGAKVKREQIAILDSSEHTDLAFLLCRLIDCTAAGQPLFDFSYNQYNKGLSEVEAQLGIALGVTPHSPRAGFASELAAAGVPVAVIKERGRWASEQSFKTYVDVVTAAQVLSMCSLAAFQDGLNFAAKNFLAYFPAEAFLKNHGSVRLHQGQGNQQVRASGVPFSSFADYHAAQCHSSVSAQAQQQGEPASQFHSRGRGSKAAATAGSRSERFAKGGGKGKSKLILPKNLR